MSVRMQMPASKIVTDHPLYPRLNIDEEHVARLEEALLAGAVLPALIVAEPDLWLVDGYHRLRAYKRIHGASVKVPVQLRRYTNHQQLFLEAVIANARHGIALSYADAKHAAAIGARLKIQPMKMAEALSMSVDRLGDVHIAAPPPPETARLRPVSPASEAPRTPRRRPVIRLGRTPQSQKNVVMEIYDVLEALKKGTVPANDTAVDALEKLRDVLNEKLPAGREVSA